MTRPRILLFALLVCLLAWSIASLRRLEPPDRFFVVDSRLPGAAPRLLQPGRHFLPRPLYRVSRYPSAQVTLGVDLGGERAVVSREGARFEVRAELTYHVPAEGVLDLHRSRGPDYETVWLAGLLERETAARLGAVSYDMLRKSDPDLVRGIRSALQERLAGSGLAIDRLRIFEIKEPGRPSEAILRVDAIPSGREVVVIGVDSYDWRIVDPLMEQGKLPNLARLVERGARANLRSLVPLLSPVIWTSIATGMRPSRHGIVDFVVTAGDTGALLPVTSAMRRVPALWNLVNRQGIGVDSVAWWATWPAEPVRGSMVTDRVAYQLFQESVEADWKENSPADNRGKTHPPELIDEVRDLIRIPAEVGDAEVAWFLPDAIFPDALSADQRERLNSFRTVIAAGETYHAIALRQFRRNDSPLKMVYYEGPDTASHLFMQFRPPRLDGVEQAEVALFGGIVDRYYERQDRFIGEILEAVGEDADIVLVSDHGFKSDNNRPPHSDPRIGRGEAAEWHTPVGVLVLAGPDIRRGIDLGAASVLDITPTILALFGLPVGRDMDGQPLAEALTDEFLEQHPVEWIDSYGGYRETGGELAGGEALRSPDAEEHLEKLRSLGYIGTERSTGHNNRGLMALQEGDVDRAIAEFERALEGGDETAVMVRVNLARAWLVKGDHDRALALVEQVLAEDPRNEQAEIIRAGVEVERGDLEAAAGHLRRAIAIDPTDVQAHAKLGEVYQRLGDSEAALVEFRKVVEIAPLNAIEHNNIGNIHRERGEIDMAIAAYRDAVRADPQYIGAYNNLGLCLQQQGRLREASELYGKALAIRPENAVLRNSLGTLRAGEGNREAAVAEFERAAAADPGWPVPQRNLARVLFEAGRFPEAKSAFERLLSSEPDSVEARLGYAMTLLMLQERDRAIAEFDEVLRRDAGNLRARIALGETLLHQGDLDSARSHLERAIEIDASIPRLYNTLGEIYLRQDLKQDAARMFEKSLSIDPDQDSVRQSLAEARR